VIFSGHALATRVLSFRPRVERRTGRKAVIHAGASCLDMTVGGRYASALAE